MKARFTIKQPEPVTPEEEGPSVEWRFRVDSLGDINVCANGVGHGWFDCSSGVFCRAIVAADRRVAGIAYDDRGFMRVTGGDL